MDVMRRLVRGDIATSWKSLPVGIPGARSMSASKQRDFGRSRARKGSHAQALILALAVLMIAATAATAVVPGAAVQVQEQEDMMLQGKRIVILVEDKVNELEALYPFLRLQEEGAKVELAGRGEDHYVGEHGLTVEPVTLSLTDLKVADFDAVIVPGGYAPERLRREPWVTHFVREMYEAGKVVAAICHGPQVLISAGILRGKRVTGYGAIKDDVINAGATWVEGEPVVRDGNLITARWPEDLPYFCPAIIKGLTE